METLPLIHIVLSADDTPCEGTTYLPLYEMPPEQGYTFDKGAEIKLKKKWWETGERTAIKSEGHRLSDICGAMDATQAAPTFKWGAGAPGVLRSAGTDD
jgi:hypothetical protein